MSALADRNRAEGAPDDAATAALMEAARATEAAKAIVERMPRELHGAVRFNVSVEQLVHASSAAAHATEDSPALQQHSALRAAIADSLRAQLQAPLSGSSGRADAGISVVSSGDYVALELANQRAFVAVANANAAITRRNRHLLVGDGRAPAPVFSPASQPLALAARELEAHAERRQRRGSVSRPAEPPPPVPAPAPAAAVPLPVVRPAAAAQVPAPAAPAVAASPAIDARSATSAVSRVLFAPLPEPAVQAADKRSTAAAALKSTQPARCGAATADSSPDAMDAASSALISGRAETEIDVFSRAGGGAESEFGGSARLDVNATAEDRRRAAVVAAQRIFRESDVAAARLREAGVLSGTKAAERRQQRRQRRDTASASEASVGVPAASSVKGSESEQGGPIGAVAREVQRLKRQRAAADQRAAREAEAEELQRKAAAAAEVARRDYDALEAARRAAEDDEQLQAAAVEEYRRLTGRKPATPRPAAERGVVAGRVSFTEPVWTQTAPTSIAGGASTAAGSAAQQHLPLHAARSVLSSTSVAASAASALPGSRGGTRGPASAVSGTHGSRPPHASWAAAELYGASPPTSAAAPGSTSSIAHRASQDGREDATTVTREKHSSISAAGQALASAGDAVLAELDARVAVAKGAYDALPLRTLPNSTMAALYPQWRPKVAPQVPVPQLDPGAPTTLAAIEAVQVRRPGGGRGGGRQRWDRPTHLTRRRPRCPIPAAGERQVLAVRRGAPAREHGGRPRLGAAAAVRVSCQRRRVCDGRRARGAA